MADDGLDNDGLFVIAIVTANLVIESYVTHYDADAHNGRGAIICTEYPTLAKHFPSFVAAFEFWRKQSTVRPYRADGKPNRPLTAYTCEIKPLAGAPLGLKLRYNQ